ncbi:MAG: hypothetical protein H6647_13905 [Anaerolineales bacterium]|nr:hypothetical protein [Anaerolineales bacterium]
MTSLPLDPIHTQEIALRNAYGEGDAERCAVHHLNLANQLEHAGGDLKTLLAHRLAGGVILFQADSPLLTDALVNLAMSFVRAAPRQPPLPREFDDLCTRVEAVDGVQFRALVAAFHAEGAADGDEAMHAVAGIARSMAG